MSADGHEGVVDAAVKQLQRRGGPAVDDLNVLFVEGYRNLEELRQELELLLNLRLADVELLALGVGAAGQAVVIARCYLLTYAIMRRRPGISS